MLFAKSFAIPAVSPLSRKAGFPRVFCATLHLRVQGRNPARFKGVFQGGKSKSPLEFVLLLCRKAKKIRVFYKSTTYVVVYEITFNHLITACGGASPQGEAFGLVCYATFDTKGRLFRGIAINSASRKAKKIRVLRKLTTYVQEQNISREHIPSHKCARIY